MTLPKRPQPTAGPVFGRTVTSVRAPRTTALRKLLLVVTSADPEPVEVVRGSARAVLPPELLALLHAVLRGLESGEALTLVVGSADPEQVLTSQQVADLLNVSRPHVVKLANTGVLPHVRVGNRHRFRFADVLSYAEAESARRDQVLAALAPEGGYAADDF
jgi:excisionase family DNA binding protein